VAEIAIALLIEWVNHPCCNCHAAAIRYAIAVGHVPQM